MGVARGTVRTFGGRLIRLGTSPAGSGEQEGTDGSVPAESASSGDSARGRYARNAIIQGSAAELFKAWAATVRVAVAPLSGRIVLCLHDELLVHVPETHAQEAVDAVDGALQAAARRWSGTDRVRFVSDTSVVRCWSDAKE
jgi:DNA polymerase-1